MPTLAHNTFWILCTCNERSNIRICLKPSRFVSSPFWLKLNDKIALEMSIFLSKFVFLDHLGQKSLVPRFR